MRSVRTMGLAGLLTGLLASTAHVVAAQEGAVLTVASDGSADHDTISAAIEAATDGDTILIAPGTYVEGLVVDKDLTITGQVDAARVVIEPPADLQKRLVGFEEEAFEVLIYAEDSEVAIEHLALGEVVGYGIAVIGGSAEIRDVVSRDEIGARDVAALGVTDSDLLALWVSGPGETVAHGNTLREGALVLDGARATFEGNEVLGGPIVADGGSTIIVSDNTFTPADDGAGVVVLDPESVGRIGGNSFTGGNAGIVLEYPVESTVEGNTVMGAASGIVVVESGGVIRGNTVGDATENGIWTIGEGMTVEGNTVSGGRVGLFAMLLPGEAHPRATDYQAGPFVSGNTITGASHFGVLVEDARVELSDNVICAGRESLKIEGEANLVLGDNDICEPEAE